MAKIGVIATIVKFDDPVISEDPNLRHADLVMSTIRCIEKILKSKKRTGLLAWADEAHIQGIRSEDRLPGFPGTAGGGQGEDERHVCHVDIILIRDYPAMHEAEAARIANDQIAKIVDEMDCDLCEFADSFEANNAMRYNPEDLLN